eukprot:1147699-Pelagomonas_calceolata.AAC.5
MERIENLEPCFRDALHKKAGQEEQAGKGASKSIKQRKGIERKGNLERCSVHPAKGELLTSPQRQRQNIQHVFSSQAPDPMRCMGETLPCTSRHASE